MRGERGAVGGGWWALDAERWCSMSVITLVMIRHQVRGRSNSYINVFNYLRIPH